jgi:hypothetical protein
LERSEVARKTGRPFVADESAIDSTPRNQINDVIGVKVAHVKHNPLRVRIRKVHKQLDHRDKPPQEATSSPAYSAILSLQTKSNQK